MELKIIFSMLAIVGFVILGIYSWNESKNIWEEEAK
jgi:hypothetical protein